MSEVYQSKIAKYAGHTAGPWRWEVNLSSKIVRMCGGKVKYDLNVMDFVRWGMSNAAPRFNLERRENLHLMTRADELGAIVPGREHHADWFRDIDHPDATLIADAPFLACEVERLRELCGELVGALEAAHNLIPSLSVVQWPPGHALKRETFAKISEALIMAKGGDQ